jgi:indole-3-glycerol phosphate synthase
VREAAMILDEILEHKRREVARAKTLRPVDAVAQAAREVREPTRGFRDALLESDPPAVIAEIKRRSPSKGEIRADFDPVACALAYGEGGAAAISVLTDEHFFGGHLGFLAKVREAVDCPLLRKDFIVDPYQIDEARVAGADAILLIAAALPQETLVALQDHARALDLDVLVEIHDEAEAVRATSAGANLVGINNRDLRTFHTDLAVSERLAPALPEGVLVVAESGIGTPADVARLTAVGAHAFLVGESLMRQPDVAGALRALRSQP